MVITTILSTAGKGMKVTRWGTWISRAVGSAIVVLAIATYLTQWSPSQLFAWLEKVFSAGFLVFFTTLVAVAIYSAHQVLADRRAAFWLEAGMHAASGIGTLALTFTLLGISLGIGSLSEQTLSPDTIQGIMATLTRHFSTAFMTTVVGLPVSNALRALLSLSEVQRREKTITDWRAEQ